jgi:hypothetical protein
MSMNALRSALALAMLCLAVSAQAVTLSASGVGQVLIYPYYTVNDSQDTLMSVVNPTDIGKAVQVRFREGYNGREVLVFDLYLSPHDVWTASISQTAADGGAAIRTGDDSCTSPIISTNGVSFRSASYDGTGSVPADSGPQDITRTREGSIELITLGDIDSASTLGDVTTHVINGTPNGGRPACGVTPSIAAAGIVAPTGGIFGSAAIVNVGVGTFYPYTADALQGFSDQALYAPDTTATLQDASSSEALPPDIAVAYVPNASGRPIALGYEFGEDAVSAVFMADALYNEYIVAASLGANTDWVVTFPTKPFYTDEIYGAVPIPPFAQAFSDGRSSVAATPTIYDREEGMPIVACGFLCPAVAPDDLAYVVNVVSFQIDPLLGNAPPSLVFGSQLTTLYVPPYGDDGWVSLDLASGDGGHVLPGALDDAGRDVTLNGLPATGFMAYDVINANAEPGLLANYSGAFHHHSTMSCSGPADECAPVVTGAR